MRFIFFSSSKYKLAIPKIAKNWDLRSLSLLTKNPINKLIKTNRRRRDLEQ
jgi:hypothetical protein